MATRRTKKPGKPKRSSGGLGNVDKNLARNKENRNKNRPQWLRVGDGNSVLVRLLTVGKQFKDGYIHQVEFEGKRGSFTRDVMCLDQEEDGTPCPGCRDGVDRRYKFWGIVLQYDAPIFDQKGKVTETKPLGIRIISGGTRLVEALNKKQKKHSLDSCPIMISQKGTGFDVEYTVEWAPEGLEALTAGDDDEPFASDEWEKVPLTDEEDDFIEKESSKAQEKVKQQTTPPEDEDSFYELPNRDDDDDDDDDRGEQSRRRGSGFAQRGSKKKGSARRKPAEEDDDDDEDDDEEEERPRQRRAKSKSTKAKPGLKTKASSGGSGIRTKRRRSS